MKRGVWIILLFVTIFALSSCMQQNEKRMKKEDLKTKDDRSSYTFGIDLARKLTASPEFKLEAFLQGFKDEATDYPLLLSQEEIMKIKNEGKVQVAKKMEETSEGISPEENLKLGEAFLAENKNKEGVKVTPSGLQYKVIREGTGKKPNTTNTVKVDYKGTLINGEVFDSSYDNGEPLVFKLGQVIKGWQEGIRLMPVGSKYVLYIPSKWAYGERASGKIAANSALIFVVELLDIVK
ncbi:MAG: FKBP-type peptidyl-prolyl cis-trans isomerase [Candidatus Delongbacteria bacterium]|jgi:FKBP-type peptidyl-prolyl cis-trans isomerase FkpA|nr:FKBP-type peptidyl-prolyl cis-trans isomerase [Candidatus Delongbacteria bacterium]